MLTGKSNTIEKEYIIISILEWRNELTFENLSSVIHYMNGQETNHTFILLGPGTFNKSQNLFVINTLHTHIPSQETRNRRKLYLLSANSPKMTINLIPNGDFFFETRLMAVITTVSFVIGDSEQ